MKFYFLFLTLILAASLQVLAQDSTKVKKRHQKSFLNQERPWTIEVPLWIPGFRGEFVYGDIDLEGEDGGDPGDPGDPDDGDNCGVICRLFSAQTYFKFFFSTRVTYNKNKFTGLFDAFTVSVSESIKFNYNDKDIVSANIRITLARFYVGYLLYSHNSRSQKSKFNLYGYGGVRFHQADIYSNVFGNKTLDINPLWAEPIVGTKLGLRLKKWMFTLHADMGGLYINDSFSYMLNFNTSYRINQLLSIKIGWNDWDVNYKREFNGKDLFLRVHLSGPAASLAFHF